MVKEFWIECDKCKHEVEFDIVEVDGLVGHIEDETEGAAREAERQFDGMIDPDDMPISERMFHDLSSAIHRGDKAEAAILLDRIAEDLGNQYVNQVQIGRFMKVMA